MRAIQGHPGAAVSSTVTKRNPRPRKYASASERQAAYRARAPEVCFRAEGKTVDTLDKIATDLDVSRADLLLSMTKFALTNHDWARFGLTHRPLPYEYGIEKRAENPAPIWERKRPKRLGPSVPLTAAQKRKAKALAAAAGRSYPNLVDNIVATRNPMKTEILERAKLPNGTLVRLQKRGNAYDVITNSTGITWRYLEKGVSEQRARNAFDLYTMQRKENPMKQPTPAQLAARERFAEMARSGAFKRKAKKAKANPRKKTVSQKISQLVHEGYPQKQAVAVALSEQRAGKVKRNPARFSAKQLDALREHYAVIERIDPVSDEYEKLISRLDGLSLPLLKQLADARIKWLSSLARNRVTRAEGVKRNPASGRKGSRTKLNPVKSTFKYALVEDDGGFSFGMDDRTPVSFVFSPRDRTRGVYRSFQLPDAAVKNPAFQQYAASLPGNMAIMSLQELRRVIKGFMG